MLRIGTVTGRETTTNRDGNADRLILQVEISNADDVQSVELFNSAGEENNPINGSQVIILDAGSAFKIAIGTNDGIVPTIGIGEKQIYSLDSSGVIAAFIKFLASGIIEINGNTDFAVRFSELKTGFDQLKTDLNDFITIYNAHNHPTAPAGPVSPPSGSGSSSAANIDSSKIDEIKVPS